MKAVTGLIRGQKATRNQASAGPFPVMPVFRQCVRPPMLLAPERPALTPCQLAEMLLAVFARLTAEPNSPRIVHAATTGDSVARTVSRCDT